VRGQLRYLGASKPWSARRVASPKPLLAPRAHQQVFLDGCKPGAGEPLQRAGLKGPYCDAARRPTTHPEKGAVSAPTRARIGGRRLRLRGIGAELNRQPSPLDEGRHRGFSMKRRRSEWRRILGMADNPAVPTFDRLMWPVLCALKSREFRVFSGWQSGSWRKGGCVF